MTSDNLPTRTQNIFQLYEHHRNSTRIAIFAANELKSCSQSIKSLATELEEALTGSLNSESYLVPDKRLLNPNIGSKESLIFGKNRRLEELNCLKNRLIVLCGCFAELPEILNSFEEQIGHNFPSFLYKEDINAFLLNQFAIMCDEEIILRSLLAVGDTSKKGLALLENLEQSIDSHLSDFKNPQFSLRVLNTLSYILRRAQNLAVGSVKVAQSSEKKWFMCVCIERIFEEEFLLE